MNQDHQNWKQFVQKPINEIEEKLLKKKESGKEQEINLIMEVFRNQFRSMYEETLVIIEDEKEKKRDQQEKEFMQKVRNQNANYFFPQTLKFQMNQVQNGIAIMKSTGLFSGLSLVEGTVFSRGSSIKFRIKSVGSVYTIGIGMCLKNIVAKAGFSFPERDQIGHGVFVIMNSGKSYCHSNKDQNNAKTQLLYHNQHVIQIRTNGQELAFRNQQTNQVHRMKINVSEKQWKNMRFCVFFLQSGEVQIVK